jgi:predicted alpha-1,6-mannanase (GH76 family)
MPVNHSKMNRRKFLGTLAVSGFALGTANRCSAAADTIKAVTAAASPLGASQPMSSFAVEGERLTGVMMTTFWDKNSRMFRAPQLSSETVASDAAHDRGETLWPSLLGMHALIEGEKAHPGRYTAQIATVFDGLEQYYSETLKAYTSWIQFPGNNDAYYDDNSWVVIIFAEAALACRKSDLQRSKQYLERAEAVLDGYIVKGYDSSNKPGGMPWGIDMTKANTSDRGTSSTAGAALAALMMARAGVNVEFNTQFGHEVLTWLMTHLLDKNGLVMDALTPPNWEVRRVKWTYNTGAPMRAFVEHYELTQSPDSLRMAENLARAALDPNEALFDPKVNDVSNRGYWDGVYFVHYLVDGLLKVAQVTPDAKLAAAARDMSQRTALFVQTFMHDPVDGLYWRNLRLYTIDDVHLAAWEKWSGQKAQPNYDESERSKEPRFASLPVKERPLVKTLLAAGGAARLFWMVGAIPS